MQSVHAKRTNAQHETSDVQHETSNVQRETRLLTRATIHTPFPQPAAYCLHAYTREGQCAVVGVGVGVGVGVCVCGCTYTQR